MRHWAVALALMGCAPQPVDVVTSACVRAIQRAETIEQVEALRTTCKELVKWGG